MKHLKLKYLWCGALMVCSAFAQNDLYRQVNLVSDVPGLAAYRDVNLVNGWGITSSGTSPWWVNSTGAGLSLLYDGNGIANPLRVQIPPAGASAPTGIVFNDTQEFLLAPGQRSLFLFASATGTISGWNPAFNATNADIRVNTPGAEYLGLTLGQLTNGQNILYAANFSGGVETFDGNFNPLPLDPNAFRDPQIPATYGPFNVQNIGGSIYVAFANRGPGGPGAGYVAQFTPEGKLVMRLQSGDWMNAPWGIVASPTLFGSLSNKLLVGQFGSGEIAAFNQTTGAFEGLMLGLDQQPIRIEGLWGIRFGNDGAAGSSRELYFAAGIERETHGLFGKIVPNAQR